MDSKDIGSPAHLVCTFTAGSVVLFSWLLLPSRKDPDQTACVCNLNLLVLMIRKMKFDK